MAGRTVMLVDDGVATGGTARVAARILRRRGASRIVLAVPVGPPGVETRLGGEIDEVRLPAGAVGLVVFAHGSGSSRLSPRNVQVAAGLNGHGFATLLSDLPSSEEGVDRQRVFDIPPLAERPDIARAWLEAVCVPTLLIVGRNDTQVLERNRHAARRLRCPHALTSIRHQAGPAGCRAR